MIIIVQPITTITLQDHETSVSDQVRSAELSTGLVSLATRFGKSIKNAEMFGS